MRDFYGRVVLHQGDCLEILRTIPDESIDAVVTDPPYGLEFMGKDWDAPWKDGWQSGGGFSKPGIGDRETPWPSFSSTSRFGAANPTCAKCGGRTRGAKRCECQEPEWKPIGKRRNPENEGLPDDVTGAGMAGHLRIFQEWCELWAQEVFRVLKPGGYLLSFGGTRTYHRMACAIEDVGFEVRDSIHWFYGSGFPKSLNISKAIDDAAGAKREVVGVKPGHELFVGRGDVHAGGSDSDAWERPWKHDSEKVLASHMQTAPATPEAKEWEGWGTALKPSHEPIVVARKPLIGTVASNVLKHRTGGLNIDGCRVEYQSQGDQASAIPQGKATAKVGALAGGDENENERTEFKADNSKGRWPGNVVLSHAEGCRCLGTKNVGAGKRHAATPGVAKPFDDTRGWNPHSMTRDGQTAPDNYGAETVEAWECVEGCPIKALDEQSGDLHPRGNVNQSTQGGGSGDSVTIGEKNLSQHHLRPELKESGGASRFFPTFPWEPLFLYCAKTSKSERSEGCEALLPRAQDQEGKNFHPTVKPIALMRWLCRLVTPKDGTVLDPFMGSGTTGIAALQEGFQFVGIEREPDYMPIAEARVTKAFESQTERDGFDSMLDFDG